MSHSNWPGGWNQVSNRQQRNDSCFWHLWLNCGLLKRKVFIKEKHELLHISNQSVESPFRDHLSVHLKVLGLAHLQFHTQLQRECKLSDVIS